MRQPSGGYINRVEDGFEEARTLINLAFRQYDVKTGGFDGIDDSTLLVDRTKVSDFLKNLCDLRLSRAKERRCFTIYVYTDVRFIAGRRFKCGGFIALLVSRVFLALSKRVFLEIRCNETRRVKVCRQLMPYYKRKNGAFEICSTEPVICKLVASHEFADVYPRLQLRKGSSDKRNDMDAAVRAKEEPIDAVVTWVDSADPKWQKLWDETFKGRRDRLDSDRYSHSKELWHCLKSIDICMPWIRQIFLVTNCSPPRWVEHLDIPVTTISHEMILADSSLPTFNSHAIESGIHRIPGLAERFIYFNDDFCVLKPTSRSSFFDGIGRPYINSESYAIVREGYLDIINRDYMKAAVNSSCIIRKLGYKLPKSMNLHAHVPYAHLRKTISDLEREIPEEFKRTENERLRSPTDLNILSFTAQWYGYARGEYVLKRLYANTDYLLVRPKNIHQLTHNMVLPQFACFNDGDGTSKQESYKLEIERFMRGRLENNLS